MTTTVHNLLHRGVVLLTNSNITRFTTTTRSTRARRGILNARQRRDGTTSDVNFLEAFLCRDVDELVVTLTVVGAAARRMF